MTRILAPSSIGFSMQERRRDRFYNLVPKSAESGVKTGGSPDVLYHYKSPTVKSDRVRATDYTRMIAKLVNGIPYRCSNGKYNVMSPNGDHQLSLKANPLGSSYANGQVKVATWLLDRVVLDAVFELNQLSANILEDLAQLRQTGQMVLDIVETIVRLYQDARNGSWSTIRRAFREKGIHVPRHIANGWLMYFYGVRPLIGTIDQICRGAQPMFKTLSVRKRAETAAEFSDFFSWSSGRYVFTGHAKQQAQCELKAIIKLDGNLRSWLKLGLGRYAISDALVLAWALAPYSFVIDWFIPVEKWLWSLTWSPSVKYQGGYTGARHDVSGSYKNFYPFSPPDAYTGELPQGTFQVRNYQRKWYPYTVPVVWLDIRLTLNLTQIISAAALIIK